MPPVQYHIGRFPPENLRWHELIPLLGPTAAAVARYDSVLQAIPDSEILVTPLATYEAVLSSRIEGTIASMGEVLEFEAKQDSPSTERRAEYREILNYRRALYDAEQRLESIPLSQRVILEIHRTLLTGTRGQDKTPGSFRRTSNWIGRLNCRKEDARYIPPSVNYIPEVISLWENYVHSDDVPDRLVQLAVQHAEFEAIHPFLDGNGRVGRMMIPLLMWQWGIIRQPRFYISAYLEANRDMYFEGLLTVSRDDDWTSWIKFFLEAITIQAEDNFNRAEKILNLYENLKLRLPNLSRSRYGVIALDWIFKYPIFLSSNFVNNSGVPSATARRLLETLRAEDIITRLRSGSGRKAAILAFPALLQIVEV